MIRRAFLTLLAGIATAPWWPKPGTATYTMITPKGVRLLRKGMTIYAPSRMDILLGSPPRVTKADGVEFLGDGSMRMDPGATLEITGYDLEAKEVKERRDADS